MKGDSNGGWIYLDSNTDLNKIDRNNVIYGKSDINSTFFYSLKSVLTPDFAKDINNQIIKVSTVDADTLWLVFSIYEIPDNEFKAFIKTINERSVHDFDVDLDEYDKILTLTTNKDNDTRIVVHAKLVKINSRVEEEKVEEKKEDTTEEKDEETNTETPTETKDNEKSDN